jgi:hypothetical protein
MQSFSPKKVDQKVTYTVAFSRQMADLAANAVLTSPTVIIAVYDKSGVDDDTPDSVLDGTAQVNADAVTIDGVSIPAGQAVLQATKAGIEGCKYVLSFKAMRPDGQEVVCDALLHVEKYVPTP